MGCACLGTCSFQFGDFRVCASINPCKCLGQDTARKFTLDMKIDSAVLKRLKSANRAIKLDSCFHVAQGDFECFIHAAAEFRSGHEGCDHTRTLESGDGCCSRGKDVAVIHGK